MAKKGLLVLVLASLVAGGAFAQFFISGEVSTDFESVTPSIGIGFGFEILDILAGFSVGIGQTTVAYDTSDNRTGADKQNYTEASNTVGIYVGIAPKATHEKWTVSIPLLASIYFGEQNKRTFDDSDAQKDTSYSSYSSYPSAQPADPIFGFVFKAGGRAEYAFSEHWSIYTGFLWDVISWQQVKNQEFKRVYDEKTYTYSNGPEQLNNTTESLDVFKSGSVQLGVKFKF